jgi:hypothetical protein
LAAGQFWARAANGATSAPRSKPRLESTRMNIPTIEPSARPAAPPN